MTEALNEALNALFYRSLKLNRVLESHLQKQTHPSFLNMFWLFKGAFSVFEVNLLETIDHNYLLIPNGLNNFKYTLVEDNIFTNPCKYVPERLCANYSYWGKLLLQLHVTGKSLQGSYYGSKL